MARRVFLERRTYRKNRLQDAARLLPVLGMILFFGPVFISDDTGGEAGAGTGLAEWLVYCFVVWAMLIALTALVNRALANAKRQPGRRRQRADRPGRTLRC
jgi:hypothetical protein